MHDKLGSWLKLLLAFLVAGAIWMLIGQSLFAPCHDYPASGRDLYIAIQDRTVDSALADLDRWEHCTREAERSDSIQLTIWMLAPFGLLAALVGAGFLNERFGSKEDDEADQPSDEGLNSALDDSTFDRTRFVRRPWDPAPDTEEE